MTQKKLILFMPSVEGGGVEKNFFIISNYLAKKRESVYLITAEKDLNKKLKNIKIKYPNSEWWRNKGRLKKYIICIFYLFLEILKNRNCLVFSFQANLYAIFLCKFLNIKVVSRSNSSPSGWSRNNLKGLIYKLGLNLADKIIVNSIEFKNEMKKKFNVDAIHIYNPLDKKKIKFLSNKSTKNLFKKKVLKIINVGRLVDQKDQITLLRSLNILKNKIKFHLIIIGRGKNKPELELYIKENNLRKFVTIFYSNNPFPHIKNSDLFILSSIFEGLPNVLLEAITLKKFVISSKCPTGPKEILMNEKGGFLFKMKDHNELAKKILIFSKKKKSFQKKIDFSYANLNRFDYHSNLKKYLNVINSL